MKIAKKFMTLALATALGVGCATVGVSAAGSRTNATSEETTDEEVKAAIDELIQKLDGKEFVTGFDEFKVLDADKAEKNADGKYEVEISVPSITDTMENIQLVAYSKEDAKKWQIVDPISVDKENKTLEVALDDGAFFTVVADAE